MIDDPVVIRLLVVVAFLSVSSAVAFVARRGIAFARHPVAVAGLEPGIRLFTSITCDSCGRARAALDELDVGFEEIAYERDPDEFERLGVTGVPTILIVEAGGKAWVVRGHPPRARLRRWVSEAVGGP